MNDIPTLLAELENASVENRLTILCDLCKAYWYRDTHTARKYGEEALKLSDELQDKPGRALALRVLGAVYQFQGDYPLALDHYTRSLTLSEQLQDTQGMAASLNNLGNVYRLQAEYGISLEYHFKALNLREKINDKPGIAASYNNIGNIFFLQGEYKESMSYHEKAMDIRDKLDDHWGFAASLSNLATLHFHLGNDQDSLEYERMSLSIRESIQDYLGMATSLHNMARVYAARDEFEKSRTTHERALQLRQEQGDKDGTISSMISLVELSQNAGWKKNCIAMCKEGLALAEEIGAQDRARQLYQVLSECYRQAGKMEEAFEAQTRYIEYNDRIYTEQLQRRIAFLQSRYEIEKKEQRAEIYRLKNVELLLANRKLEQFRNNLEELVEKRTRELEEKQEQLLHAQRLATLGEMATAITHEMRQPLTIMHMQAELIKMDLQELNPPEAVLAAIDSMFIEIDRATDIMEYMRKFSRRDAEEIELIDLHSPIRKSVSFFLEQFRNNGFTLGLDLAEMTPPVPVNNQRIEQVLVNFLTNARHALILKQEEDPKAKLDATVILRANPDAEGIVLEVVDTGIGMTEEVLSHCLEPFYTTKDSNVGTGLGLSIVRGIIAEFGGQLTIDSVYGKGTTMRVTIPTTLSQEHHRESPPQ